MARDIRLIIASAANLSLSAAGLVTRFADSWEGIVTGNNEPDFAAALLRHFADLRDRRHGDAETRPEKERLFAEATALLDPYARQVLDEVNVFLLLGTGEVSGTGVRSSPDGGVAAVWSLSWPQQRTAGIDPVVIRASYGAGFHHPHLGGGTVGEWPLNVFTEEQAAAELPTLRAIVAADVHNLVFQQDYRIIPATVAGATGQGPAAVPEP